VAGAVLLMEGRTGTVMAVETFLNIAMRDWSWRLG
jgi:hypothetical protein